jgi:hypothetical protein
MPTSHSRPRDSSTDFLWGPSESVPTSVIPDGGVVFPTITVMVVRSIHQPPLQLLELHPSCSRP